MNRKHRHYSEIEKQELLDRIESSGGPIREALARLGISKSTYYDWKNAAEIRKGLRTPTENSPRNFYLVSQALKHQKTINRILAYRISTSNSTRLTKSTMSDALAIRQPTTGLVFHSDQGTNYTARAYPK